MNREALIEKLVRLSVELARAEAALLRASVQHAQTKFEFEETEARLVLLHGADLGKNELERKAKLHVMLLEPQGRLQEAAESRDRAAVALRSLQAEASLLRSVARLLAAAGEGGPDG